MKSAGRPPEEIQILDAPEAQDEARECVRLFCDTMAELDRIYERRADWLVRLAMLTAEVAASSPSGPGGGDEGAAKTDGEKLAALAEQARAAAGRGDQGQDAPRTEAAPNVVSADGPGAGGDPDVFCEGVRQALLIALTNSVSSQQALDQLGLVVVAKCVQYLLPPRDPASKGGGS
ncbi:MAG TPA: hypothetical protein VF668_12880 [Pyrinomonadaceae bacterium]|jgi:hypothetical protein